MASVHLGQDLRLQRAVAVKILHAHVAESPEARERLAREARAIAQLKHDGVIEVYDYSIDDDRCTWLVSELVEGSALRKIIDRHERFLPEVAVMIVAEVVRALKCAHDAGVVHRDVKPDNILVGKEGRPKLSDFGIAKVLTESQMTVTGNLVGSPSYMSPEQADGERTDHRTDLFSVGTLLYRMVTGKLPFKGNSPIDTIRKVADRIYTDPVDLQPDCAGPVAGILRRALAFELEERYQNADEMLADLNTVLQDADLTAPREELPKFFADPPGYQEALKPRLAKTFEARGQLLLNTGQEARAIDCFNRALSLGNGNQNTVDLVKELSKKRGGQSQLRKVVIAASMAVGALGLIAAIVLVTDLISSRQNPQRVLAAESLAGSPRLGEASSERTNAAPSKRVEAAGVVEAAPQTKPSEQIGASEEPEPAISARRKPRNTRRRSAATRKRKTAPRVVKVSPPPIKSTPPVKAPSPKLKVSDAPEAPKPEKKAVEAEKVVKAPPSPGTLHVGTKHWVDVYVDGRKIGRAPNRSRYQLSAGHHVLRAEKPDSRCIPFERPFTIKPGETTRLRLNVVCP